ncbi:hypothetical protein BJX70DRAFT_394726 [Aspergillus crustosus]
MGGRYDATNIIPCPVISVITHIFADHVGHLGPDMASIAWHKAGIIKSSPSNTTKVLIFTHFSKRNGAELLQYIQTLLDSADIQFDHVILTTFMAWNDGPIFKGGYCKAPEATMQEYKKAWEDHNRHDTQVWCESTIENALACARDVSGVGSTAQVLVTGSLRSQKHTKPSSTSKNAANTTAHYQEHYQKQRQKQNLQASTKKNQELARLLTRLLETMKRRIEDIALANAARDEMYQLRVKIASLENERRRITRERAVIGKYSVYFTAILLGRRGEHVRRRRELDLIMAGLDERLRVARDLSKDRVKQVSSLRGKD